MVGLAPGQLLDRDKQRRLIQGAAAGGVALVSLLLVGALIRTAIVAEDRSATIEAQTGALEEAKGELTGAQQALTSQQIAALHPVARDAAEQGDFLRAREIALLAATLQPSGDADVTLATVALRTRRLIQSYRCIGACMEAEISDDGATVAYWDSGGLHYRPRDPQRRRDWTVGAAAAVDPNRNGQMAMDETGTFIGLSRDGPLQLFSAEGTHVLVQDASGGIVGAERGEIFFQYESGGSLTTKVFRARDRREVFSRAVPSVADEPYCEEGVSRCYRPLGGTLVIGLNGATRSWTDIVDLRRNTRVQLRREDNSRAWSPEVMFARGSMAAVEGVNEGQVVLVDMPAQAAQYIDMPSNPWFDEFSLFTSNDRRLAFSRSLEVQVSELTGRRLLSFAYYGSLVDASSDLAFLLGGAEGLSYSPRRYDVLDGRGRRCQRPPSSLNDASMRVFPSGIYIRTTSGRVVRFDPTACTISATAVDVSNTATWAVSSEGSLIATLDGTLLKVLRAATGETIAERQFVPEDGVRRRVLSFAGVNHLCVQRMDGCHILTVPGLQDRSDEQAPSGATQAAMSAYYLGASVNVNERRYRLHVGGDTIEISQQHGSDPALSLHQWQFEAPVREAFLDPAGEFLIVSFRGGRNIELHDVRPLLRSRDELIADTCRLLREGGHNASLQALMSRHLSRRELPPGAREPCGTPEPAPT